MIGNNVILLIVLCSLILNPTLSHFCKPDLLHYLQYNLAQSGENIARFQDGCTVEDPPISVGWELKLFLTQYAKRAAMTMSQWTQEAFTKFQDDSWFSRNDLRVPGKAIKLCGVFQGREEEWAQNVFGFFDQWQTQLTKHNKNGDTPFIRRFLGFTKCSEVLMEFAVQYGIASQLGHYLKARGDDEAAQWLQWTNSNAAGDFRLFSNALEGMNVQFDCARWEAAADTYLKVLSAYNANDEMIGGNGLFAMEEFESPYEIVSLYCADE